MGTREKEREQRSATATAACAQKLLLCDGVGSSGRQNIEMFLRFLLSIDEHVGVVTARPDFRSPRSSSRS
eukprot:2671434-Pleurochrysis_carterae.AAC.4